MKRTYYVMQNDEKRICRIAYDKETDGSFAIDYANGLDNLSCFARKDNLLIVSANRCISSFNLNDGNMELVSQAEDFDSDISNVCISNNGRHLYALEYETGNLWICDIEEEGVMAKLRQANAENESQDTQSFRFSFMTTTPDDGYLLGIDPEKEGINMMKLDESGDVAVRGFIPAEQGFAPRHMHFSDDGKHLYADCGEAYHILIYEYDEGTLTLINDRALWPDLPECVGVDVMDNVLFVGHRGNSYNALEAYDITKPCEPKLIDVCICVDACQSFKTLEDGYICLISQSNGNIKIIRFADGRFMNTFQI